MKVEIMIVTVRRLCGYLVKLRDCFCALSTKSSGLSVSNLNIFMVCSGSDCTFIFGFFFFLVNFLKYF